VRTNVVVSGMSCVHCKRAVFTALAGVRGVLSAEVSIGRAEIDHEPHVTADAIRDAIRAAGYDVSELTRDTRTLPQLP
jgi:copper chaperone